MQIDDMIHIPCSFGLLVGLGRRRNILPAQHTLIVHHNKRVFPYKDTKSSTPMQTFCGIYFSPHSLLRIRCYELVNGHKHLSSGNISRQKSTKPGQGVNLFSMGKACKRGVSFRCIHYPNKLSYLLSTILTGGYIQLCSYAVIFCAVACLGSFSY